MHGRGMVRRSLIWTVFSSRMRDPASQERTMFCAIWSCGPAAGPTGFDARRPWNVTDVSRSAEPFQNFRAGRSKIFSSRSSSRSMRRRRFGKGAGIRSTRRLLYRSVTRDLRALRCHHLPTPARRSREHVREALDDGHVLALVAAAERAAPGDDRDVSEQADLDLL